MVCTIGTGRLFVHAGLKKSLNCSKTQGICAIKHMICTNTQKNHYSLAVSNIVNWTKKP